MILILLILFTLLFFFISIPAYNKKFLNDFSLIGLYAILCSLIIFLYYFCNITYELYPFLYKLLVIIIATIIIYYCLYNYRDLEITFTSLILFKVNFFIFAFYLLSIYYLFQKIWERDLEKPMFIENLSSFSQYRYLILVIVSIVGGLLLLYINFSKSKLAFILKFMISNITHPYLYEESRKLLSTWEDSIFGTVFEKFLRIIVNNNIGRFIFFFIHLVFYTLISFTMTLSLLNIAFLNGDLRYIFYLFPLSFLSWIYRHLFFYFNDFVNLNIKTIKEYIDIKILKEAHTEKNDILSFDSQDLFFSLKDKAYIEFSESYNKEKLLNSLTQDFLLLSRFNVYYKEYQYYFYYFQYIILSLRVLAWVKISLLFFSPIDLSVAVNILSKLISGPIVFRSYVTKAYFMKKASESAFEKVTNGDFKSGHPIAADTNKADSNGMVYYYHLQLTHGKGPVDNPSKPLSTTNDVQGNPLPQNGVYPKVPVKVSKSDLGSEIPGSEQFFKQKEVEDNHKVNRGKDGEDF